MNDLNTIKQGVNLIEFARSRGLKVTDAGKGSCPFHPPDGNSSFSIFRGKDGYWRWKDFHDDSSGTIVDLLVRLDEVSEADACRQLLEKFGDPRPKTPSAPQPRGPGEVEREHVYLDEQGKPLFKKIKFKPGTANVPWAIFHMAEDGSWQPKMGDMQHIPYRLNEFATHDEVVICEGEKDADTVNALNAGIFATSAPMGCSSWPDEITPRFSQFKRITFLYDVGNDGDVKKHAAKLHATFPEAEISIARVPGKIREFDITDLLDYIAVPADKIGALKDILKEAEVLYATPPPTTIMLSNVEPRTVPWLWRNFIPLGRGTLISGDPGSGKTFFVLDVSARVTRARPWADGTPGGEPANVYYMTVEDDAHDTIRPRIDSLGGDPSKIAIYNAEHPLHLDLSTEAGLLRIEREIIQVGNIRLVVVDPILDFSGGVNPNAGEEVRVLLTPLIRMAAKHNFALILIGHLNKAQTMSAIYRAGGSTSGWLGKCRASFMVFRDINDKTLRHVIPIKANLSPQDPPQLEFTITNGQIDAKISTEEVDPEEMLNPQQHGPDPRERDEAIAWLDAFFGKCPELPAKIIEDAAKANDISQSTLRRAKKHAGYHSEQRTESGSRTFWVWTR